MGGGAVPVGGAVTVDQFWKALEEQNGYDTPADARPGLADRLLGRFDTWYHLRVLGVVARTSWRLRRAGRPFDQAYWGRRSYAVLRTVEACGGRVHVRGIDHIRSLPGPAVYVANHMSMIETLLLPVLMLKYRLVTMVIKQSLLRYPVFGTVMRACRPVAVSRRDPREDLRTVMQDGERVLRAEGRSIIIFPQATRSPLLVPAEFNSLGVKLARAAGVPVVPVALKTDFHGIGRRLRDFGPVDRSKPLYVEFGPPLAVSGTGRDQHAACVAFIASRLREWGGEVEGEMREGGRC